jgi:hypothetical protein
MRMKTCMCGAKVSKVRDWDEDLDQCKTCTQGMIEKQRQRDYLDEFKTGDLFSCLGKVCLLIEKLPKDTSGGQPWKIHDIQAARTRTIWVSNWLEYGTLRELRDAIHPLNGEDDEC